MNNSAPLPPVGGTSCVADLGSLHGKLGRHLDNMVRIQMRAYPADWSEADKREMAEKHLFGTRKNEELSDG